MKKALLISALAFGGALTLENNTNAHGGTYRGPGDTVPPGGGDGGPGPAPPTTPGPPGSPTGGGGASTPGPQTPRTPGDGGVGTAPTTGGTNAGPDLTNWQFWWGFNKDPYLNLKAHVNKMGPLTGSPDIFLGHGEEAEARDLFTPSEEAIRDKIVPALIDALNTEKNNDILTGCLVALAKIGDSKDLQGESAFEAIIAEFLDDPVQEVRETAAAALGILGNSAAIDTLEALALDTSDGRELVGRKAEVHFRTRAFATYGLGLVGFRANAEDRARIVRTLQSILEEPKMSTRDVKVAAVLSMGLVPVGTFAGTDLPKTGGRIDASLSREHQVAYLLQFFKNERERDLTRAHAPRSLARLTQGAPESLRESVARGILPFVGKGSGAASVEIRQGAALALGQLGNCDGTGIDELIHDRLMQAKKDPQPQVRYFAFISLAQMTGRAGSKDAPFGAYDLETLKSSRKFLQTQLAKTSMRSSWAAMALGVMGHALNSDETVGTSPDVSLAMRMEFKKATAPDRVGSLALGLGLRGDLEAEVFLGEKLDQVSDDQARGQIAIALGLMGSRGRIDQIQEIVARAKYRPDLLKRAAIALGLLGDKTTVPELLRMLEDARSLASQASIAQALGFIGDSRSIDPLVAMLENDQLTSRSRAFAAVALGIVGDKEMLPWNSKISVDINYRANTPTLTGFGGTGLLDIL